MVSKCIVVIVIHTIMKIHLNRIIFLIFLIHFCSLMTWTVTASFQYCVCVCLAHFRCRLPGRDHQRVHSLPTAGSFLSGVENIFGHAARRRRRKPGEEPARICCEDYFACLFCQPSKICKICIFLSLCATFLNVL